MNTNKTQKKKDLKESEKTYFSLIILFSFLLGVKLIKFFSSINIFSPVDGFLPFLELLDRIEKLPKPRISILLPFEILDDKKLRIFSSVLSTSLLGK